MEEWNIPIAINLVERLFENRMQKKLRRQACSFLRSPKYFGSIKVNHFCSGVKIYNL